MIDYAQVLEIINASANPPDSLRHFVEQEREDARWQGMRAAVEEANK